MLWNKINNIFKLKNRSKRGEKRLISKINILHVPGIQFEATFFQQNKAKHQRTIKQCLNRIQEINKMRTRTVDTNATYYGKVWKTLIINKTNVNAKITMFLIFN